MKNGAQSFVVEIIFKSQSTCIKEVIKLTDKCDDFP